MQDPEDTAAAPKPGPAPGDGSPASNVLPLFARKGPSVQRRSSDSVSGKFRVDSAGSTVHDATPESIGAGKKTSPRRHTMPRLAREALDTDGLNQRPPDGHWATAHPGTLDWNHAPTDRREAQDRHLRLARTLEVDIIPRLVNVHRALPSPRPVAEGACAPPSPQDVEDFVRLLLAREEVAAHAFIDMLVQRGMTVETLYLDLLAPSAQHLDYLWSQDLCEFTDVTLGLARLQRLLHEVSLSMRGTESALRSNARRVLLMPACGEQQTFGLSMVAEFFHSAGWEVDCGGNLHGAPAVDLTQTEWFDVIGLAAGSETGLEPLRRCIRDLRQASRNKQVGVLVGGPIFAGHPERVKFVGADACGLDGKQAPAHAERLIAARANR
ncbi:MAG: cobalamin B12-binding domain-containing protein [Variovorax sp.]